MGYNPGGGAGATTSWAARITATDAALPAYTRVGNAITGNAPGALPAIGGVALALNQSFLHKNGAAGADNGLWDVKVLGDGITAYRLERSSDASTSAQVTSGRTVRITGGVYAGLEFYLATPNPIVLNTTALNFQPFQGVPASVAQTIPIARGAYGFKDRVLGSLGGPEVLAEFDLDAAPLFGAELDAIVLVTQVALTGLVYLYDVVANATVAGSSLSTSSTTGARLTSGDLTATLIVGRRYQIRAECTGGTDPTDWASVRYATLVPT